MKSCPEMKVTEGSPVYIALLPVPQRPWSILYGPCKVTGLAGRVLSFMSLFLLVKALVQSLVWLKNSG